VGNSRLEDPFRIFQKRPVLVKRFGHLELDTVVSGRGKSKGCVAMRIEGKTHLCTTIFMPNCTALSMEIALGFNQFTAPHRDFSHRHR
jgi:hypothetical protein